MSASFQRLIAEAEAAAGDTAEIRTGLGRLSELTRADPDSALMRVRKALEFVVRDLFARRFGEPPGTRPLENLLQRLSRESDVPRKVVAAANLIREMGNLGVHGFGEPVTPEDVERALAQLVPVLDWYRGEVGPTVEVFDPVAKLSETTLRRAPRLDRKVLVGLLVIVLIVLPIMLVTLTHPRSPAPAAWDEGLAASPALRVMLGEGRPPGAAIGGKAVLNFEIFGHEPASGEQRPVGQGKTLRSGDRYHIEVLPGGDGYLYVLQVDGVGKLTLLHPTLAGLSFATGRNPVRAGRIVRVPSSESGQDAVLDSTTGIEHVYCVLAPGAWPELEEAIVEAETRPRPGVPVSAPFRVATRGVERLVPASRPAGSPTFEGVQGFLVVSRWFQHEPR